MEGSFIYFDQVEVASPGRGDLVPDGRPISLYGGPSGVVLDRACTSVCEISLLK